MGSETECELGVVNFSDKNMKPGSNEWASACRVVRRGLERDGCFIALYDQASPGLCNSMISAMGQLFHLPLETKMQETSPKIFHGYYGQYSLLPLYESLGIDDPLTMGGCLKFAHIMWPQGNDRFCEIVNEYARVVGEIDRLAYRMMFESYGLDQDACDSLVESNNYLLRCFKYRKPEMQETDLGIHAHTDMSLFSILQQLNFDGLEVKPKDAQNWIKIEASPSSFVVMAGDALKAWSNGRVQACEHRAMMKAEKTRYSMGLFSFGGKTIEVPEELVDEKHPLLYKPFDHYEFLRFCQTHKIQQSDARITSYFGL